MDIVTIIIIILSISVSAVMIYEIIQNQNCNTNLNILQTKYDHDTIDSKKQLSDVSFKLNTITSELNDVAKERNLYGKNIIGKFDNSKLINKSNLCVNLSTSVKDMPIDPNFKISALSHNFSLLQINKQPCTDNDNIFSYDPVNKQILVKSEKSTKCIESLNDTDIILNDCIKNSQKQTFNYYPLSNGTLQSVLYSKCLSYNSNASNIIDLDKCSSDNNIIVPNSDKNKLYLINT